MIPVASTLKVSLGDGLAGAAWLPALWETAGRGALPARSQEFHPAD